MYRYSVNRLTRTRRHALPVLEVRTSELDPQVDPRLQLAVTESNTPRQTKEDDSLDVRDEGQNLAT
jgi:hypothetical protein